jgi:hypothetical protein
LTCRIKNKNSAYLSNAYSSLKQALKELISWL